jgi:histidyl-tRNA synthetase
MIQKIRGTRDILDTTLLNYALTTIKKHLLLYNHHEIITPILESTELFKRSLGLETDVVSKEMFIVSSSSSTNEESICLRPEATASTVRAFIENGIQTTPWKVFTYGPMFRYERPQKGRYRQFTQFNIETIGSAHILTDVETIIMLDRLFHEQFSLENYALHINFLGIPEERQKYKKVLYEFLMTHKDTLCATCLIRKDANILRIFDCKETTCQDVYENAPMLEEFFGQESATEWNMLQHYLEELAVTCVINRKLVRGLDYYNKTVFEFVSTDLGSQTAFCGGGRYDSLASALGAKVDQPSFGAAIGIDRLILLLEQIESTLSFEKVHPLYAIVPFEEKQHPLALHIADALRRASLTAHILTEGSLKSMMKKANTLGARGVLLLGEQEQNDGTITYKDMIKGTQETVGQAQLIQMLKNSAH